MLIPDKSNKKKEVFVAKLGPKGRPALSQDQIEELREKLKYDDIIFFIVPSQQLNEMIVNGGSPLLKDLASNIRLPILEGKGVIISNKMIVDWIEGKLDLKNAFMLNNSEIRVLGAGNFKVAGDDNDKK